MNGKTEQNLKSSNTSYYRNSDEYDEDLNIRKQNREDLKYIINRTRSLDVSLDLGIEGMASKGEESRLACKIIYFPSFLSLFIHLVVVH